MTSYFTFVQNQQSPFSFSPVLDGQTYTAAVKWNWFGQRWYLELSRITGALVFNKALIGSPCGVSIESVSWSNGLVTVTTAKPHGFDVGTTVAMTVEGCVPVVLNGTRPSLITDVDEFTFPLVGNPGAATQLGRAVYNINLAAGYFTTSTLVYRSDNKTFEVSP